jgi:malate dehydrogenase
LQAICSQVGVLVESKQLGLAASPVHAHHGSGKCPHSATKLKPPVRVCITGAAGQLAYNAIFMVSAGQMLGVDQPVELRLLDIAPMTKQLQGVAMEVEDCAYPLVSKIVPTTDYKVAFQDCDYALLIGARPRGPGMQRGDLLKANAQIFSGQGKALNDYASRNVKVLVVGNPANTNCLIAIANAPDLPKQNFTAMTRLDQNRAQYMLAAKAGVAVTHVKNVIIWGNHSKTQYPDVNHGLIENPGKIASPIRTRINDDAWLNGKFIADVQDRGAAIIAVREKSSAASAANAAIDHMRDWVAGTKSGEVVSMGVYSNGEYGQPSGIVYSFPCICEKGNWRIVQGLKLDAFSVKKMKETADELLDEKKSALGN